MECTFIYWIYLFTTTKLPMSFNKGQLYKSPDDFNTTEKLHFLENSSHNPTRHHLSSQALANRQSFDARKKHNNPKRHPDGPHLNGFRRNERGGGHRYRSSNQSGISQTGPYISNSNGGSHSWNNSHYPRDGYQRNRNRPLSNEIAKSITRFPKLDSLTPDVPHFEPRDHTLTIASRQNIRPSDDNNKANTDKYNGDTKALKDPSSTSMAQNRQDEKGIKAGTRATEQHAENGNLTDKKKHEFSRSQENTPITVSSQESTGTNEALIPMHLSAGLTNEAIIGTEDDSETETVICESQSSSQLGFLTRRRGRDGNRTSLKRKAISSSSSDDSSDEERKLESEWKRSTSDSKKQKMAIAEADSEYDTSESSKNPSVSKSDLAEKSASHNKLSRSSQLMPTKEYKLKRDPSGKSQLQRACKKGEITEVQNLLSKGADPNECDFGGFTCLHEAALAGHTEIAFLLLESGAEVNRQALEIGDLETPLMDACENKHLETVELLLRHGADPHICNVDGFSTFTKLQGLQVDDKSYKPILEILEKYSSTSMDSQESTMLNRSDFMIEDTTESYFGDLMKNKKNNVFRLAAQGQKEATAEHFITHALDLRNMPDILFLAARNGHTELVDILLGLNPNPFDINQKNKLGITILHATVGRGFSKVVEFLLSRGADPNICRTIDGKNALQMAKSSTLCDPKEVLLLGGIVTRKPSHVETDSKEIPRATNMYEVTKSGKLDLQEQRLDHSIVSKPSAEDDDELKIVPKSASKNSNPGEDLKSVSTLSFALKEVQMEEVTEEKALELSSEALKEQERLKQKAAEEAKIWQQKMQAKKKARKEMFLLAEKEKEKRRKEIEIMKLKELKEQEERKKNELLQEALEAEKQALVVQQKQAAIEIQFILLKYPIGLQEALFNGPLLEEKLMKYAPLYVFTIGEEEWVLDMQISLLLSNNIRDIHEVCNASLSVELNEQVKDKMWPLFFHMIGISKLGIVESNGREKFHDLSLHFIKLSAASNYVKTLNPIVYSVVWGASRLTKVDMNSIEDCKVEVSKLKTLSDENNLGFVPPKLRKRCDVVHTIHTAMSSLW